MRKKLVLRWMLIAVLVLGSGLWRKAYAVIPVSEREALIALYQATDGDHWTNNSGWKIAEDEFSAWGTEWNWQGITLDSDDPDGTTVTRIHLGNNNLVGSIPSKIGDLQNLIYLNLDGNQLGTLPEELGDLTNLQTLSISYSQLTGEIPSSITKLVKLQTLILEGNRLTGSMPPDIDELEELSYLSLAFNGLGDNIGLSGTIPTSLGSCGKLTRIDLQVNALEGNIPDSLGNLTMLKELYLYQNKLSGPIPSSLGVGDITDSLWKLDLNNNQLNGSIPSSLGNLDKLYRLDLNANQLMGPIPGALGNMDSLEWLLLRDNQLTETIPENLKNLSVLAGLDLGDNQLTGNIPSWLNQLTNLTHLYLDGNQFNGGIPWQLGTMANLYELHLGENQLTGSIPSEFAGLENLWYLYLDNNNLSGAIPSVLGDLTELRRLSLNGNAFSGSIPVSLTNLTNLTGGYLDLGYNALYTDDDAVLSFLGAKDWNWYGSQTVAPEGVSAVALTATSVTVSYTPIIYDWDSGGYRILCSESQGGPYTLCGMTADKEATELEVAGLTPGTAYYFVVQTRTDPHTDSEPEFNNPNTLDSEYSEEVSAETPVWADLSVTKTDDPDPVTAGEILTYTVTVQNDGPSDAVNVTLTDSLPSQMEGAEYSTNGGQSWANWLGSLGLGTMAASASGQVLIRGTVASSATGTISNTATVGSETTDPDIGNNEATQETAVEAKANLLVTKSDSADPVIAGLGLTYTITVQNQGPSSAVNVTLTDTVPSALQNPEYSTDGGQTWTAWPGSLLIGTLGASASQQVLIRGTIDASTTGTISNSPSVSSDTADPDTNDNSVSEDTLVEAEADVSVTKADDGFDPILPGHMLTYVITVENAGPSDAVSLTVTDNPPNEVSNPQFSTDGGKSWSNWPGSLNFERLDAGSLEEVLIKGQIVPSDSGTITNTASVASGTNDPITENNSDTEETVVAIIGDMDGDGDVDLADTILVLQVLCGMKPAYNPAYGLLDLDGDGKISRGELFYVLQKILEFRQ